MSGKSDIGVRIPSFKIKNVLESNPLKPTMLVEGWACKLSPTSKSEGRAIGDPLSLTSGNENNIIITFYFREAFNFHLRRQHSKQYFYVTNAIFGNQHLNNYIIFNSRRPKLEKDSFAFFFFFLFSNGIFPASQTVLFSSPMFLPCLISTFNR